MERQPRSETTYVHDGDSVAERNAGDKVGIKEGIYMEYFAKGLPDVSFNGSWVAWGV